MVNSGKHFTTIDALRGLAALMVCFYHFSSNSSYYGFFLPEDNWLRQIGSFGWLGVEMFFVISGFVIPYSLYKNQYTLPKIGTFIVKRWIRIEPPYLATIALILLNWKFNGWLWSYPVDIHWKQVLSHVVYIPQFIGYAWINEIFWTLAIEFQYYLFISIAIVGLMHSKAIFKGIAVLAFILPFFVWNDNRIVTSYSSLFMLGITAFWFKTEMINKLLYWVLTISFVALAYFQFPNNPMSIPLTAFLTSLAIVFVNYQSVVSSFLGKISYSLYLTHGLIGGNLIFFSMYLPMIKDNEGMRNVTIFVAIAISVLGAWVFHKGIESRVQRIAQKIKL